MGDASDDGRTELDDMGTEDIEDLRKPARETLTQASIEGHTELEDEDKGDAFFEQGDEFVAAAVLKTAGETSHDDHKVL